MPPKIHTLHWQYPKTIFYLMFPLFPFTTENCVWEHTPFYCSLHSIYQMSVYTAVIPVFEPHIDMALRFQWANLGTARKKDVIPQNSAWACLLSLCVFPGTFIFHLGFLWRCGLRKGNTCLGWLLVYVGQMILSGCCSCGDSRRTISHMSKTSGNCMHYGGPTQPAQHCATAQVPGNIG